MQKLKALVIDDDPGILDTIEEKLILLQHECDCVGSVSEAQGKLAANSYDYVILDMEIPIRCAGETSIANGKSFLRELRQKYRKDELPIIFITGRELDKIEHVTEVMWNDANDFITKPFAKSGEHTLEASIRRYTAEAAGRKNAAPSPDDWLSRTVSGGMVAWKTKARNGKWRECSLRESTIQNRLLECIYEFYRKNPMISHFDIMSKCGWHESEYFKRENGKRTPTRGPVKNHVMKLRTQLGIRAEFSEGGINILRPEE
ncbi:MAG: Transcriptional regulatory protein QseB [Lentisphaerae bacterium ADurb.Bin242]|nr:MAG: Transcriptional regulatory protein QseB [Lentisphaerae bacterium ADurb.Bin242]